MKIVTLWTMVFIFAAASIGNAAPLDKTRVMKDISWILHIDCDQFNRSLMGMAIKQELATRGVALKLDNFANVFSFNPLNDIRNVTLFGQDKDPLKAVAVIQGKCTPATLIALVAMNPAYEKSQYGNYTIHSWIDQKTNSNNPRQYGCFHDEQTVVMSMGLEVLQKTLDVLDGKGENAGSSPLFKSSGQAEPGMIVSLYADKVSQSAHNMLQAAMLQKISQLTLCVGETEAKTYVNVQLVANNSNDAVRIQQFVQGIMALVSFSAGKNDPKVNQLIEATSIQCSDSLVSIQCKVNSLDLVTIAKEMEKKRQTRDPNTK